MADQPQAGSVAQPSHQLVLEQRQHLVRSVRRVQPVSQLSNGGPAPHLFQRHRPVTQLGRGHGQEGCGPPRLEVHADGPGLRRVAELEGATGRGDHAAVGVLGRLDVGAGTNEERCPEVDDEERRRTCRQRQPGVRRCTLQVVEVVDQPVQRRSRQSGHVLHAHSIAGIARRDGPATLPPASSRRRSRTSAGVGTTNTPVPNTSTAPGCGRWSRRIDRQAAVRDHCWLAPVLHGYCLRTTPSAVDKAGTSTHLPLWRARSWK